MKKIQRLLYILAVLVVASLAGFEAFDWTVDYIYVPAGESVVLRYKGPLIFTWGSKFAEKGHFAKDGEIGI